MYAIVKTGGKQYRVETGDYLKVEKLGGDPGDQVDLSEVLAVDGPDGLQVGAPTVPGAIVKATIVRTHKDRKIIVFKKKRRKGYKKKQGHRQWVTLLKIDDITSRLPQSLQSADIAEAPGDMASADNDQENGVIDELPGSHSTEGAGNAGAQGDVAEPTE